MTDRARGALLGTLIGDALGRPFEGAEVGGTALHDEAVARRMAAPRAWGHSDDGEMMLGVAASLVAVGTIDEGHLLATLAAGHEPARGYGKGARAAFAAHQAGAPWTEAGRTLWPEGSMGNGAAVRVAPVGVWGRHEAEVAALGRRSALCTHLHEDASSAAAVVAVAVHRSLRDAPLDGIEAHASPALAEAITEARGLAGAPLGRAARRLGCGVLAIESVPAALWAVGEGGTFAEIVARAVRMGGDTDSIGAIAGAIAGARVGAAAIDPAWRAALEPGAVAAVETFVASCTPH